MNDIKRYEPLWGSWTVDALIGEGSFGKVYRVKREEFGRTYYSAVKIISIPQGESDIRRMRSEGLDDASVKSYFQSLVNDIIQEIDLMSKFKGNSNVVSFEDHRVAAKPDGVGWDILIRMELLTSLSDYAANKPLDTDDIITLGVHICRALELCSVHNTIHRDIKPDNIFVSEYGQFKLGDFGIARQIERTMSGMSKKGTYDYMAPEVFKGEKYGANVDTYSLGIVLYRYLNQNRLPFWAEYPAVVMPREREDARTRRIQGEALPPIKGVSDELNDIILKACSFDRNDRYQNAADMRVALEAVLNGAAAATATPPKPAANAKAAPIKPEPAPEPPDEDSRTEGVFDTPPKAAPADRTEATEGVFSSRPSAVREERTSMTEGVWSKGETDAEKATPPVAEEHAEKPLVSPVFVKRLGIVGGVCFCLLSLMSIYFFRNDSYSFRVVFPLNLLLAGLSFTVFRFNRFNKIVYALFSVGLVGHILFCLDLQLNVFSVPLFMPYFLDITSRGVLLLPLLCLFAKTKKARIAVVFVSAITGFAEILYWSDIINDGLILFMPYEVCLIILACAALLLTSVQHKVRTIGISAFISSAFMGVAQTGIYIISGNAMIREVYIPLTIFQVASNLVFIVLTVAALKPEAYVETFGKGKKALTTVMACGFIAIFIGLIAIIPAFFGAGLMWSQFGAAYNVVLEADADNPSDAAMEAAIQIITRRLDNPDISNIQVTQSGANRISVSFSANELISAERLAEFWETAAIYFVSEDGDVLLDGSKIISADSTLYKTTDGKEEYGVSIQFTSEWLDVARLNPYKKVSVVLDGTAIFEFTIMEASSTYCVLTGNFTKEEAEHRASTIRAGALPFALTVLSMTTNGNPSAITDDVHLSADANGQILPSDQPDLAVTPDLRLTVVPDSVYESVSNVIYAVWQLNEANEVNSESIESLRTSITSDRIVSVFVAFADGRFYDLNGWEPPSGFNALERPWYLGAVEKYGNEYADAFYVGNVYNNVQGITCYTVSSAAGKAGEGLLYVVGADVLVTEDLSTTPDVSNNALESVDYVVQAGDTLMSIAEKFYGDGNRFKEITDANGIEPDVLYLGMVLTIPYVAGSPDEELVLKAAAADEAARLALMSADPISERRYLDEGKAAYNAMDYLTAKAAFLNAVPYTSKYADEVYYYLGQTCERLGEKTEAKNCYLRVAQEYPDSSYAADSNKRMNEIKQ